MPLVLWEPKKGIDFTLPTHGREDLQTESNGFSCEGAGRSPKPCAERSLFHLWAVFRTVGHQKNKHIPDAPWDCHSLPTLGWACMAYMERLGVFPINSSLVYKVSPLKLSCRPPVRPGQPFGALVHVTGQERQAQHLPQSGSWRSAALRSGDQRIPRSKSFQHKPC